MRQVLFFFFLSTGLCYASFPVSDSQNAYELENIKPEQSSERYIYAELSFIGGILCRYLSTYYKCLNALLLSSNQKRIELYSKQNTSSFKNPFTSSKLQRFAECNCTGKYRLS